MSHQSTPLTEDQVTSFHSEGYLVVEDLLTSEEVTSFVEYEAQGDQPGPRGLQNHKIDAQWAHQLITPGSPASCDSYADRRPA